jgi:hypothetical protein
VRRNLILLGGTLDPPPAPGVTAAYVLRCHDTTEATRIVAEDPLVASGACDPFVATWDLVGINTSAIDRHLAATPDAF